MISVGNSTLRHNWSTDLVSVEDVNIWLKRNDPLTIKMDFNAYLGISLGFLFTVMGTSFASVRTAELIDNSVSSYIPLAMAGVLAIYGTIVSILATLKMANEPDANGDAVMAACLVSGFANLFSGIAMARISPKTIEINKGLMIALVFIESIGLYGLVISLIILK